MGDERKRRREKREREARREMRRVDAAVWLLPR